MILIGLFDSPFVRRVAVSMRLLGLDFEHRAWSVGKDFARIREYNPLGRVPTLVLEDGGETLIESAAILDHLDEIAGPARALLPPQGTDRRRAQQLIVTAVGAAEKGVAQVYENVFRPAEKRHEPWTDRCASQMHAGLATLDAACAAVGSDGFLVGGRLTQADITITCAFTFLNDALGLSSSNDAPPYAALRAHVARFEAMPEFSATRVSFTAPAG